MHTRCSFILLFLLSCPGVLECWSVTYTHQRICALKGSSVVIGCSYSYPNTATVNETFWHKLKSVKDLSEEEEYKDRIKYQGNKESNCSMKIERLAESDSAEYKFRFLTNEEKYSGSPGVQLSVSTLQVVMSSATVTKGQNVTLTCNTSCLANTLATYIWYQNGKLVTGQRLRDDMLILSPVSRVDAGSYSCALRGHKDYRSPAVTLIVQYAPGNFSVSVSPSSSIVEASSVTLTCSCDANPTVHKYTWYKKNRDETLQVGLGQKYSITNISSQESGYYYCRAENEVGDKNSSFLLVNVYSQQTAFPFAATMVSLIVAAALVLGIACLRKKRILTEDMQWTSNNTQMKILRGEMQDTEETQQEVSCPMYINIPIVPMTSNQGQRVDSGDQDDVQYASIKLKVKNENEASDSTAVQSQVREKEEDVQYASVQFHSPSSAVNKL